MPGRYSLPIPSSRGYRVVRFEVSAVESGRTRDSPQKQILTYHVVKGSYPAAKVLQNDTLTTLQGGKLMIKQNDAGAMVNNAKILKTDIECSNGIIHVIDTVVLPEN